MPTLEQSQYGFDRDSRRTWQRRSLTDAQDQQYSYDALGQVNAAARGSLNLNMTAISGIPASAQSWDYDPTGNWRGYHSAANGTSTLNQHRVHDRGNRLTQIEDNPSNMILDRVGRMRQMSPDAEGDWDGTLELTWDAWSRITRVKNNGEVVGEYSYDGTCRRVTREVSSETLHSYYNDEWRPVEERKGSETTAAISYLWGARHRDDLVRRDRAVGGTTLNETRYVLMDYFNPASITDTSGVVKERYAFSAFGVRSILNPDFTMRSSSECSMEFAFQGQFLDVESGLMNYGYRYYTPNLGRWTCKDPIGEKGGVNLYQMIANNPVNGVDHLGLQQALNLPNVNIQVVQGPRRGNCGDFSIGLAISLQGAAPCSGHIVQEIKRNSNYVNCKTRERKLNSTHYFESWEVASNAMATNEQKGGVFGIYSMNDTWSANAKVCTYGSLEIIAEARFTCSSVSGDLGGAGRVGTGINGKGGWFPGTLYGERRSDSSPMSGDLPSSRSAPTGWPTLAGPPTRKVVRVEWDCCDGDFESVVTVS